MKSMNRFPCQLGAASSLALAACGVLAQEPAPGDYPARRTHKVPPIHSAHGVSP